LLTALCRQETGGRFTYSINIVDNDDLESARAVVTTFAATAPVAISYDVEPQQNIALARNKTVANATGDFLAMIDDDEEPFPDWLLRLFEAMPEYAADGVLGPVIPRFLSPPPDWAVDGRCFERPSPPTGTVLKWRQTRTGNVLLRRSIFDDPAARFRAEFGFGGEDSDFFKRQIAGGRRFVWCAEAKVYEYIPVERCSRRYLLKRALLRGAHPNNRGWLVLTSLVAIPSYAVVLPILFVSRHPAFTRYLISACSHISRVLAFAGGRAWQRVLPPGRP
jgi:glycosyltransferase involved in cell wall biosynthesis